MFGSIQAQANSASLVQICHSFESCLMVRLAASRKTHSSSVVTSGHRRYSVSTYVWSEGQPFDSMSGLALSDADTNDADPRKHQIS